MAQQVIMINLVLLCLVLNKAGEDVWAIIKGSVISERVSREKWLST